MALKTVDSPPELEALRQTLIKTIQDAHPEITPYDVVATLAYACGQFVAYCDQNKVTPEEIMAMVAVNITLGNAKAREELEALNTEGKPN